MKKDIKKINLYHTFENVIAIISFIAISTIPFLEIVLRNFNIVFENSTDYVIHFVFLIACFGISIATREKQHLNIGTGITKNKGSFTHFVTYFNNTLSIMVLTMFFFSSFSNVFLAFESDDMVGIIPKRLFLIAFPLNFLITIIRVINTYTLNKILRIIFILIGFFLGCFFSIDVLVTFVNYYVYEGILPGILEISDNYYNIYDNFIVPLNQNSFKSIILLLFISLIFENPLYIALGGIGLFAFLSNQDQISTMPLEGYNLFTSESITSIALFTLTGFILAQSKAGERLIRLFKAFFSWLPGGIAIATVLVSAFFTTFTGASGVTILALGSLLYSILRSKKEYSENYSIGLIANSGSIGLLFPPSLAIILYGSTAQISILKLFKAGVIPGILLVSAVSLSGVVISIFKKGQREKFDLKEAFSAFLSAIFEIALPFLLAISYFGGFATLLETASCASVYVFIVEIILKREIKFKDLLNIFVKCITIVGGILSILAVTKGLSMYIIFQEIPQKLALWVTENIHSKFQFLIILNILLIIVGCFMDIFSAILVVAPLVIPMSEVFDINPYHLGIIFLLNLEIGYTTPPIGLNLFLASYAFNKPLTTIYKSIVLFFIIEFITLLLITYIPQFSTIFLRS